MVLRQHSRIDLSLLQISEEKHGRLLKRGRTLASVSYILPVHACLLAKALKRS